MRIVFIFLFIFLANISSAQEPVQLAVMKLEKALIDKDTITLRHVLHRDLSYGHSNGWIETKAEMINNLVSGKMQYSAIVSENPEYRQTGDVMTVRTRSKIGFVVDGKMGELNLMVVQVWMKEGNDWQLLVRQSTKLN